MGARATVALDTERALDKVRGAAPRFAALGLADRVALARAMQEGYRSVAAASVAAACAVKGLDPHAAQAAEEWGTGPWCVVRHLRLVLEQLRHIERHGTTRIAGTRIADDGRTVVDLLPDAAIDRVLFRGVTIGVRMQAGIDAATVAASRASLYRAPRPEAKVVLVLGAGNVAAIGPMDVITKLFNEGKVCLLKMNPINAYLGPLLERAFAQPIAAGYLAIVYGGAEEGRYLVEHPAVDEIHLTGSNETHDAVVWGPPGSERDARKRAGRRVSGKPITSELGNVSPVLLVPGPYTDAELAYQAEDLSAYMTMNAAFYCNAARVLVTPAHWPQRERFLALLTRVLERIPVRRAYYPGAVETWQRLRSGRPNVCTVGRADAGHLPWTLMTGLDPGDAAEVFFQREHFCAALGETALASGDPLEFLERAVEFANARLWGTLSATLIVHSSLLGDAVTRAAVERAIARLRYGTVAVNGYPGVSFALASPPWGGFPGATPEDIQSGSGWVHNTAMLEGIEKVVVRFPLTQRPKPVYFPSHRHARETLEALTRFDVAARWRDLPRVLRYALRA